MSHLSGQDTDCYLRRSLLLWEFLRIPFTITFAFVMLCFNGFYPVINISYLVTHLSDTCVNLLWFGFSVSLLFNWLPILDCLLHIFLGFSLKRARYPICFTYASFIGWFCSLALLFLFGCFLFPSMYSVS